MLNLPRLPQNASQNREMSTTVHIRLLFRFLVTFYLNKPVITLTLVKKQPRQDVFNINDQFERETPNDDSVEQKDLF